MECTARTRFNRSMMVLFFMLTLLFLVMFGFGMFCLLSDTLPQAGFVSDKFMAGLVNYGVFRGLTNALACLAVFIFNYRVHNIDDLVTQAGSYELRWLGIAFVGIWAGHLLLAFFVPGVKYPPNVLVFLGVLCLLLFKLVNTLASRVDMYLNSEGGHSRLGDLGPIQFIELMMQIFKKKDGME